METNLKYCIFLPIKLGKIGKIVPSNDVAPMRWGCGLSQYSQGGFSKTDYNFK